MASSPHPRSYKSRIPTKNHVAYGCVLYGFLHLAQVTTWVLYYHLSKIQKEATIRSMSFHAIHPSASQEPKYSYTVSDRSTGLNHESICAKLTALENQLAFTKSKQSHEHAKEKFLTAMLERGLYADIISPGDWDYSEEDLVYKGTEFSSQLNPDLFYLNTTMGVEKDIPEAANNSREEVHLFSVASQFNAAEAPYAFIPPIGKAMEVAATDHTQGPLAQSTNPGLFELVNAFLANLGFNMLEAMIPSAGSTIDESSSIYAGYLKPSGAHLTEMIKQSLENHKNLQLPCYESVIKDSNHSIFIILSSGPAYGYCKSEALDDIQKNQLQYIINLATFSAFFQQVLTMLKKYPHKPIVLHITGVGLGVFGNNPHVFQEAFHLAGMKFQEQLQEKARVRIQLDSYKSSDQLALIGKQLELKMI